MEIWDVYDADRQLTGDHMIRGHAFKDGDYHLVVHVCVFDSSGRMLIQQRTHDKETFPDMWDITMGGSSVEGENAQMAAERELYEELGIKLDLKNIRPHLSVNYENGFDDFFLLEEDMDPEKLVLQKEEVQAVKWADKNEILQMIENGKFIAYYKELIELLFAMKGNGYSAHNTPEL